MAMLKGHVKELMMRAICSGFSGTTHTDKLVLGLAEVARCGDLYMYSQQGSCGWSLGITCVGCDLA